MSSVSGWSALKHLRSFLKCPLSAEWNVMMKCSWCSWCPYDVTFNDFTSSRDYSEFNAPQLEPTGQCHWICSTMGRRIRWPSCFSIINWKVFPLTTVCSSLICEGLCCPDPGRDQSVTLPASSSSYLLSGLRLGRHYRFTVQPMFASGLGSASSVNERTGTEKMFVCFLCCLCFLFFLILCMYRLFKNIKKESVALALASDFSFAIFFLAVNFVVILMWL